MLRFLVVLGIPALDEPVSDKRPLRRGWIVHEKVEVAEVASRRVLAMGGGLRAFHQHQGAAVSRPGTGEEQWRRQRHDRGAVLIGAQASGYMAPTCTP